MKRSTRAPRTSAKFSESVQHRLNMYALAASAAGVGVLALAQPAGGKIVYTQAHKVIEQNSAFRLDLNHDGVVDFTIHNFFYSKSLYLFFSTLLVEAPPRNGAPRNEVEGVEIMYGSYTFGFAAALKRGDRIPNNPPLFFHKASMAQYCLYSDKKCLEEGPGPWYNVTKRYLGLMFREHGKIHYGWARFDVRVHMGPPRTPKKITAVLTGYAYETIPGKEIVAGKTRGPDVVVEPATLGHLARGASAISSWRIKPTAKQVIR